MFGINFFALSEMITQLDYDTLHDDYSKFVLTLSSRKSFYSTLYGGSSTSLEARMKVVTRDGHELKAGNRPLLLKVPEIV